MSYTNGSSTKWCADDGHVYTSATSWIQNHNFTAHLILELLQVARETDWRVWPLQGLLSVSYAVVQTSLWRVAGHRIRTDHIMHGYKTHTHTLRDMLLCYCICCWTEKSASWSCELNRTNWIECSTAWTFPSESGIVSKYTAGSDRMHIYRSSKISPYFALMESISVAGVSHVYWPWLHHVHMFFNTTATEVILHDVVSLCVTWCC